MTMSTRRSRPQTRHTSGPQPTRAHTWTSSGAKTRNHTVVGIVDTSGGVAIADNKAHRFDLHSARARGARFVRGTRADDFDSFFCKGDQVAGIQIWYGVTPSPKGLVMACGGWTPSLVPPLDGLLGCCVPAAARITAYNRFVPDRLLVWVFKSRDCAGGGLYGFLRDDQGLLKIGF